MHLQLLYMIHHPRTTDCIFTFGGYLISRPQKKTLGRIIRSLGRYWSEWIELEKSRVFFPQKSAVSISFLGRALIWHTRKCDDLISHLDASKQQTRNLTDWAATRDQETNIVRYTIPGICLFLAEKNMHQQIFEKPRHKPPEIMVEMVGDHSENSMLVVWHASILTSACTLNRIPTVIQQKYYNISHMTRHG